MDSMTCNLSIGDKVVKKSGKPFKGVDNVALKHDFIAHFEVNEEDPQRRLGARLKISNTVVNVYQIKKEDA